MKKPEIANRSATFRILFVLLALAGAAAGAGYTAAQETTSGPIDRLRALIAEGEFEQAEAGASAYLEQLEAAGEGESVEAARTLDVLAESRWRAGKVDEPETREHAWNALTLKERLLGPNHAEVAESLNNLAVIAFFLGDYAAAREPWERALAIREAALGADDVDVAQSMNNLANLLQTVGEYEEARSLYEQALAIREKALGPDDRYVAQTLNNLGWLVADLGDFVAARAAFERALAIREQNLGGEHPKVASSLAALATLLWKTGDRETAHELFERSLDVWRKALGPDHPYVAASMNNLGWLLVNAGAYPDALPLLEGALRIWRDAYGDEHADVALALHNLGELKRFSGDFEGARPLLEQAAAIREQALGTDHPDLAESLNNLAKLLFAIGDAEGAMAGFERAVEIREHSFGRDHPDVAESLGLEATLLAALGQNPAALEQALESERIARDHLRLTGRSLSEQEALQYAAVRNKGLDLALSLAIGADGAARGQVLDALIRSRAVVLDEMVARNRTVIAAGDPEISGLADTLERARARLAHLTVRGLGDEDPGIYRELLEAARAEKVAAERALAGASVAFAREREQHRLGLDEVIAGLPDKTALVAFVLYDRSLPARGRDNAGSERKVAPPGVERTYAALVLRSAKSAPMALNLGAADEIDELVAAWKREAATGAHNIRRTDEESLAAYRKVGDALRFRIWDPLQHAIGDAERVLLVPDGALNLVSFVALPVGTDRFLLEEGPLLHYLSAERDVAAAGGEPGHGKGLLAIGGPDYDVVLSGAATTRGGQVASTTRGGCGSFDTLKFEPLPEARLEAEEIVELWRQALPDGAELTEEVVHLEGAAAGESAFKDGAVGRRVLHIATHGFFLGGDCAVGKTRSRGFEVVDEPTAPALPDVGLSPLLLSGLALAGANQRRSAGSVEDDGVLTAEEMSSLDLSGVEWAVLSACDTGVGEIEAGEGVFGLRRAMQLAGVRTLIMSLWPVDDEATRQWMNELYRSRLVAGSATAEAVQAAGLEVLTTRREADESTHPFYWAAFVAAGDWQ